MKSAKWVDDGRWVTVRVHDDETHNEHDDGDADDGQQFMHLALEPKCCHQTWS